MSFAAALKDSSTYQFMEIVKDGICYLTLMNGKDSQRAVKRFEESGYISLKEGTILWQGPGYVPQELRDALTEAGLLWPRENGEG